LKRKKKTSHYPTGSPEERDKKLCTRGKGGVAGVPSKKAQEETSSMKGKDGVDSDIVNSLLGKGQRSHGLG